MDSEYNQRIFCLQEQLEEMNYLVILTLVTIYCQSRRWGGNDSIN